MLSYEITKDADADLEGIARYTIIEWGAEQAKLYLGKLHQCFQDITAKKALARTFSLRLSKVLVTRCEHHYVFYLHPEKEKPIILAVLHERMDMVARLQDRLG